MLFGILVKVILRKKSLEFTYLNFYGPYLNKTVFQDSAIKEVIFYHPNLINVGDINFKLLDAMIWGKKYHIGTQSSFFTQLFVRTGMMDIAPTLIVLTWRITISRSEGISKKLEISLVSPSMVPLFSRYRAWTHYLVIYHHFLDFLEWDDSTFIKN